jgi:hypothetical protein
MLQTSGDDDTDDATGLPHALWTRVQDIQSKGGAEGLSK